ncbi:glycosyl hydrolase 9C1 [Actinidia rufa]|uniref:Endoglucanase n=1 Tax=Actinidia rufa TaxID=165716 RepID=A0A7J0HE94_9ERIC|nr:glycosyl hydrolase 9C1 [Actinidia rufa]
MAGFSSWCVMLAMVVGVVGLKAGIAVAELDYGDAVDKSLMFMEAQRSGKLPINQRVRWRGDSGLRDGFLQGVDLVGGYYDAGDHVKFGLPMAYSVTMLSWGAIDYRREMVGLNQMGPTLAAIKWGTDYFIKAHPQPNVLWAQVGDGDSDHYCWERAEDMTTSRTAYKLDPSNPGSDLAAETAAALAAASLAFKPYNTSYSNLLLIHSKQLFSFADTFRGLYDDSIKCAKNFYTSSGYSDELLWAATWLFRATNDEYYLKYVSDNAASMGGTGWAVREFSWDNKYAGVQILLSKVLMEGGGGAYTSILKQYQAKADFLCMCLCGLVYVREWNNMQYAASAAFLAAVYSDYLSKAHAILKCPDAQADYMLGKNPKSMSYIVGYGQMYPLRVHHRGASITSISLLHSLVGCVEGFETWYHRPEANPNIIYGALVGGPDNNDGFNDDRSNYEQTEPTISGSAPLVGLFTKLQSVAGGNSVSYHQKSPVPQQTTPSYYLNVTPAPKPKPDIPVEFFHSITKEWTVGRTTYYRHKVIIKNNISQKPITDMKLNIDNLSGSVWGLSPTQEHNTYELPQWHQALKPGSECSFVYVQGGPQAKVSVQSYH